MIVLAQNYILLERIELAASAASVTFSNIPQSGYTDLKIVLSTRVDNGGSNDAVNMALNTDAFTTNASIKLLRGNGSSALSASGSYLITGYTNGSGSTANTFGNHEVYIPNYLSSNYKSISTDSVYEDNTTTAIQQINALLWSNTAAINKITFAPNGGSNFSIGSTFSLYGLAAVGTTPVIAPKATGGTNIQTDGTYWYHTFLASGTFTPSTNLTADVLVVAGGGGGASRSGYYGAGGGAGALLTYTSQALTATGYTCTIGAGGTWGENANATQGVNSQFGALTAATGGGYGGVNNGGSGGSGGGATRGYSGGTGSPGYNGGSSASGAGGAGGGMGGVGTSGDIDPPTGGVGITTSLTDAIGSATGVGQLISGHYYLSGGGGGAGDGTSYTYTPGGNGGGGRGAYWSSYKTANTSGTANTGGGGGGGFTNAMGGTTSNGGSGVIIIRYAV